MIIWRFLRITLISAGLLFAPTALLWTAQAKTVDELRQELQDKKEALKETDARIQKFKEDIQVKKKEARTLADQIEILDDNVQEIQLSIDRTDAEISKTATEVEAVEEEIKEREAEIGHQKDILATHLRALHLLDQQTGVTVFLKYETFSEAMSEAATVQELQARTQVTLTDIQRLRDELQSKRQDLQDFQQTLEELQTRQQHQQDTLQSQQASKARILQLTQAQEAQYQDLLKEAQSTHQQAQAAIKQLDTAIREELEKQGYGKLPSVGVMSWPIEPIFGVSCEFHCGGYPYAYLIGPHSAIDIPSYVGTPIKAPADGYVARVFDSGGPGYSYIMLLHGENVSTVYGHVSGFAVNEGQAVTRGTVIGYTGGASGMRGSGLSTGPHLHFEVRVNNSPVNPRKYLGG